jgi:hypothetical protein
LQGWYRMRNGAIPTSFRGATSGCGASDFRNLGAWTLVRSEAGTNADETLLRLATLPASGEGKTMDRSIHQARWLLGPLFGLCFGVALVGLFFG